MARAMRRTAPTEAMAEAVMIRGSMAAENVFKKRASRVALDATSAATRAHAQSEASRALAASDDGRPPSESCSAIRRRSYVTV